LILSFILSCVMKGRDCVVLKSVSGLEVVIMDRLITRRSADGDNDECCLYDRVGCRLQII